MEYHKGNFAAQFAAKVNQALTRQGAPMGVRADTRINIVPRGGRPVTKTVAQLAGIYAKDDRAGASSVDHVAQCLADGTFEIAGSVPPSLAEWR